MRELFDRCRPTIDRARRYLADHPPIQHAALLLVAALLCLAQGRPADAKLAAGAAAAAVGIKVVSRPTEFVLTDLADELKAGAVHEIHATPAEGGTLLRFREVARPIAVPSPDGRTADLVRPPDRWPFL